MKKTLTTLLCATAMCLGTVKADFLWMTTFEANGPNCPEDAVIRSFSYSMKAPQVTFDSAYCWDWSWGEGFTARSFMQYGPNYVFMPNCSVDLGEGSYTFVIRGITKSITLDRLSFGVFGSGMDYYFDTAELTWAHIIVNGNTAYSLERDFDNPRYVRIDNEGPDNNNTYIDLEAGGIVINPGDEVTVTISISGWRLPCRYIGFATMYADGSLN